MPEFTDNDSRQLLTLLYRYQQEFLPDLPQTIPALAEDLAMSLDITSDQDDMMQREVCAAWDDPAAKWPIPRNIERG